MELQHHGIQGQKWGIKNGPPYPLERKKNARKYQKKINELNKTYAKLHYQQDKYQKKAQRLADKGKDPSEYIKQAKGYLTSRKAIEWLQSQYVEEAKNGGYEVTNVAKFYDARPSYKKYFGGAVGSGIAAARAIKKASDPNSIGVGIYIRPYYKIKMPKINIE